MARSRGLLGLIPLMAGAVPACGQVSLELVGRYETGVFAQSAAEIVAHEPRSQRLFVTNGQANAVDVLRFDDPAMPALAFRIDLRPYGGGVNSVAVRNGLVAVAVEAPVAQDPGSILFFDADGNLLSRVTAGALPDSVAFTPDGAHLLSANEGEPNDGYTVDPAGSVSVVTIPADPREITQAGVRTADFLSFDSHGVPPGVRVFGPGARPSQDLEPEYIAFSSDSATAFVVCQENNAIAVVDIATATVTELRPLGFKNHSASGNGFDASDDDGGDGGGGVNIRAWPVWGMYQPDSIAAFDVNGRTFIATANEGDPRGYAGFDESAAVRDLTLDAAAFPNAASLQTRDRLGRLRVTTTLGDTDGDGDFDELYAFGARSMSIWDDRGRLVWDSGDAFERITAAARPDGFNATNDANGTFDDRSRDRGPEPEALAVAAVGARTLVFVGLERVGGIVVFDVTDPASPVLVEYTTTRDFEGDAAAGTAGDLGPECIIAIEADDSPDGTPLLVVANEVSGTVAVYRIIEESSASTDPSG